MLLCVVQVTLRAGSWSHRQFPSLCVSVCLSVCGPGHLQRWQCLCVCLCLCVCVSACVWSRSLSGLAAGATNSFPCCCWLCLCVCLCLSLCMSVYVCVWSRSLSGLAAGATDSFACCRWRPLRLIIVQCHLRQVDLSHSLSID